jgi:hypothetical protein
MVAMLVARCLSSERLKRKGLEKFVELKISPKKDVGGSVERKRGLEEGFGTYDMIRRRQE